ncbi:MAG: tRNA (adenosine(37)-N6)-dimethylallyltransferase MiaA [Owenweeksia sp.]|nr:tRNA (adenosine(37)-N6)-dimethylallyltransferase MiaA [Owenweeksia sp.]
METKSSKQAIFITGPTAVGKTNVALQLAQWLGTEIVSFDSRQFYRELKIGAAPPTEEELQLVSHHLIGHLSVKEEFNAGQFETAAMALLQKLFKKYDRVLLVGGSGMYMNALAEGFDTMPAADPKKRKDLNEIYRQKGLSPLQKELKIKDPKYYKEVDPNNPQRLIRALEVIRTTGQQYSDFRKGAVKSRPFDILKIGLNLPRALLYERINSRVDQMMATGLLQEVKSLVPYRGKNALQTVGYRELIRHLDGELSLEEAVVEIKKNSRRYAKRQLTWFRRDKENTLVFTN